MTKSFISLLIIFVIISVTCACNSKVKEIYLSKNYSKNKGVKLSLNSKTNRFSLQANLYVHMIGDIRVRQNGTWRVDSDTILFSSGDEYDKQIFESAFTEKHVDSIPNDEFKIEVIPYGYDPEMDTSCLSLIQTYLINQEKFYMQNLQFGKIIPVAGFNCSKIIKEQNVKSIQPYESIKCKYPVYHLKDSTTNCVVINATILMSATQLKNCYFNNLDDFKVLKKGDTIFFNNYFGNLIRK